LNIINENYILISLEYREPKKFNFDSYYISLLEDTEYLKIKKENAKIKGQKLNLKINYIPQEINEEFIELAREKHDKELSDDDQYCFPVDFAEIKRVVHTHTAGGKTKYINKSPGVIVIYKYLGPITLIEEFIKIVRNKFSIIEDPDDKSIFSGFAEYKIFLSAESEYLTKIINHNYFIAHFEFIHENADPNDFRRNLLGTDRKNPIETIGTRGIPKLTNEEFLKKFKGKREMDENQRYTYPIDFAIIKKPIRLYTKDNGERVISNRAAGVILIYQYMGPITIVEDFRAIFAEIFEKEKEKNEKSVFHKANEPLILIGANLNEFEV